jgi:hypothetical protein
MTLVPFQHYKGFWLIGLNPVVVDSSTRFGDRWTRRVTYDAYWSGTHWVRRIGFAIHFENESLAFEYLESNVKLMEKTDVKKTIAAQFDRLVIPSPATPTLQESSHDTTNAN